MIIDTEPIQPSEALSRAAEEGRNSPIMTSPGTPSTESVLDVHNTVGTSLAPAAKYLDTLHIPDEVKADANPSEADQTTSGAAKLDLASFDPTSRRKLLAILEPSRSADSLPSIARAFVPHYFSPKPLRFQPSTLPVPEDAAPNITPRSKSAGYTPAVIRSSQTSHPLTPGQSLSNAHAEKQVRPGVLRDESSASTASNAKTIRASDFNSYLQLSHSQQREHPINFPNQAYSALQSQSHTPPSSSLFLRSRNSHSANHAFHSARSDASSPAHEEEIANVLSSSTTNSVASSPGLFIPTYSHQRTESKSVDLEGTYSGPWLHHTHRQAPKETHVADVEVDPISGRKIINQYEIMHELGRGNHGKVKLGRDLNNGTYVAIKIVERYSRRPRLGKNNSHEVKIKKEIAILKKARHPNVVGLLEVIDDPRMKKVYIVLEHVAMGEVRWRTEGAKEICLLEWRRCLRESDGVYENDDAAMEDERILQAAQQRLKRAERRKWRRIQKQRLSSQGPDSWSLEHGNGEDDEYFSSSNVSRVPSATTALSDIPQKLFTGQDYAFSPQPMDNESEMLTVTEDDVFCHVPEDVREFEEEEFADYHHSGLEGSKFGAYEAGDLLRGRTPSVGGSSGSIAWEHEYEDQIPEHFHYVPLLTLEAARRAFRDTVLGLEYLHWQGVIHRDIKPANLLQAKDHHIKISDFGVSYLGKEKDEEYATEEHSDADTSNVYVSVELAKTVGTPAFYAPELCATDFDPDAPIMPVTGQIDIWALGVTLYCLVFGRVPFHADNPFALMRIIADQDLYIPNKRLKAVEEKIASRPPSLERFWQTPTQSNTRLPHQLEYEEVDDELTDLLKRMLTKDPNKRITLTEIKHHSWVVKGITDPVRWLEQTDPSRMSSGRRIEVSKEDVDVAVVPLTVIERATSVARKTIEKLGAKFGMSKPGSRRRAKSTATAGSGEFSQPISTASSSSTMSQDARRQEMRRASSRPEESICTALKTSRDREHPLSQSVTASPVAKDFREIFADQDDLRSTSPMSMISQSSRPRGLSPPRRPCGPERAQSILSGTGSVRTIRPGDLSFATGASTFPALPSTPLEMPTHSSLGGIFEGTKRSILRRVRSRDPNTSAFGRSSPVDLLLLGDDDAHGEPSLAFSTTVAAGHVNLPASLTEGSMAGSSAVVSPLPCSAPSISSRVPSFPSPDHFRTDYAPTEEGRHSRNSSLSSLSSHPRKLLVSLARMDSSYPSAHTNYLPLLGDTQDERRAHAKPVPGNSVDQLFTRAKDEQIRRRILENEQRAKPSSSTEHPRTESKPVHEACPPSPDDDVFYRRERGRTSLGHNAYFGRFDSTTQPTMLTGYPPYQGAPLVSSSSEEQFTRMSQSTSNPSIPSIVSNDSSIAPEEGTFFARPVIEVHVDDSRGVPSLGLSHLEDDVNYDGDHAVESDEGSEDSFVEMTRHKSRSKGLSRSEGISIGDIASHLASRDTAEYAFPVRSTKSVRSGSNNTMKKVESQENSPDDEHGGRA